MGKIINLKMKVWKNLKYGIIPSDSKSKKTNANQGKARNASKTEMLSNLENVNSFLVLLFFLYSQSCM